MNEFMASVTAKLNALIGGALIFVSLFVGANAMSNGNSEAGLAIISGGFVATAIFCGVIAILVDIRNTLKAIAKAQALHGKTVHSS